MNHSIERLPILSSVGYASGNFAKSIINTAIDIAYIYFLVEYVGISPWLAGTILLFSLIWDGLTDPLFGFVVDKWLHKLFSYRRIIVIGTPLCAISFVSMFLLPVSLMQSPVFWVIITSLLFRSCYTLVEVPHNAMLANITLSSRDRNTLSTFRFMFSTLGGLALAALIAPLLETGGTLSEVQSLSKFSIYIALMFAGVMFFCVYLSGASKTKRKFVESPKATGLARAVKDIWNNIQLRQILIVCFLSASCITVFSKMTLFYAKFVLNDASLAPHLINSHLIGQLLCLPLWHFLSTKVEKRTVAIIANTTMLIAVLVFLIIIPQHNLTVYFFFFIAGASLSGLTVMNWSIVPDAVDFTEKKSGFPHVALSFGLLLLISKVANGIAAALVGWSLEIVDTSALISQSKGVTIVMTSIPAIGATISIYFLSKITLNYREHQKVVLKRNS